MDNNRFFTLDTESRQQFYQVPKAFMCKDTKYFSLSPMSKLLYGILADRNSLSIQNGWIDELKRIYFIFIQSELCELLGGIDPKTLRKYLKELEKAGLLLRKRMGLSKADRLYLLQVESSQTLINSLMGKNSLSREGKSPYQDREKIPTNYTDNNNTDLNKSSSKKILLNEKENQKIDNKEDDDIEKVLLHCQICNYKLQRRTIERLIKSYKVDMILQAITTAATIGKNEIKKPASYLITILNDMTKEKKVIINKETKGITNKRENKFKNFNQRKYSSENFKEMEQHLLSKN